MIKIFLSMRNPLLLGSLPVCGNEMTVGLRSLPESFGLPERDLRDNIALGGDSVLLAILIHVTRQSLRSGYSNLDGFGSTFQIRHTQYPSETAA
jgi:hypothetical protein